MLLYSSEGKDPNSTVAFELDWTPHLGGTTLGTSTWLVPSGITIVSTIKTDSTAIITLSGGTVRQSYRLTNRVNFVGGGTEDWTLDIRVEELSAVPQGPPFATISECQAVQPSAEGAEAIKIEMVLNQSSSWVAKLAPRPVPAVSTVVLAMDAVQTTVPVLKIESFRDEGMVVVEGELIQYTGRLSSIYETITTGPGNLTGAMRGRRATAPAAHAFGVLVEEADYPLRARDAELAVFEWLWDTRGYKPSRTGVVGSESYSIDPGSIKEIVKATMGRYYNGGMRMGKVAVMSSFPRVRASRW
ncbi:MAG: hypothetical protein WKF67_07835 [Rubrobacteraceae bacterium]